MKKVSCACGAEFKTHTEEEVFEIANVHTRHAHKKDLPRGLTREEVKKMIKEA